MMVTELFANLHLSTQIYSKVKLLNNKHYSYIVIDAGHTNMKGNLRIEEVLMKADLVFSGVETSTEIEKLQKLNDILQKVIIRFRLDALSYLSSFFYSF